MAAFNAAWLETAVASGMPRAEAEACAQRTLAVYTGQAGHSAFSGPWSGIASRPTNALLWSRL